MPEISFWSKWPIWNPFHFEFDFVSIHVNTSKELPEHQSEISTKMKSHTYLSSFPLSCERTHNL